MAKRTRFPLKLKDDVEARTLEELREHFDLEKIIGYFQDGRLLTWLQARYYEDEAEQVEALDKASKSIGAELCRIFGVETEETALNSLDVKHIKVKNERIARLKQHTGDKNVIENVDCVAFNQEELDQLLDNGVAEIYLCNGKFAIPIKQKNKKYIGIGKVEVVIKSKKAVNFEELGISFKDVEMDEKYVTPTIPTADSLLELANGAMEKEDYAQAEKYWLKAAEMGSGDAMYALGNMYRKGAGVKESVEKAVEWFKKAVKHDNAAAMFNLGCMYANGEGVRKNRQQAVKLLEQAASKGNSDAAYQLGDMYYKGEGVTQDFKRARNLFQMAADENSADAMLFLGDMYQFGHGIRKNIQRAIEYYEKSAEGNNPEAMERLGNLYQTNEKVQDYKQAMIWFKKASEYEIPSAMTSIGYMYDTGLGVSKNHKQAARWYQKAADLGDADAMCKLGCAYMMGAGINKDEREGMRLIQMAADAGDGFAQEILEDIENKEQSASKANW